MQASIRKAEFCVQLFRCIPSKALFRAASAATGTFFSIAFKGVPGIDSASGFALGKIGFLSWQKNPEEEYSENNAFRSSVNSSAQPHGGGSEHEKASDVAAP
jgi:hypothetical protein